MISRTAAETAAFKVGITNIMRDWIMVGVEATTPSTRAELSLVIQVMHRRLMPRMIALGIEYDHVSEGDAFPLMLDCFNKAAVQILEEMALP